MQRKVSLVWRVLLHVLVLAILLFYHVFVGKVWFLELAAFIPPNTFLCIPFVFGVWAAIRRSIWQVFATLLMAVVILPQTDLWGLTTLSHANPPINATTIRVLSLNTEFWESSLVSEQQLIEQIKRYDADIVLLQENWGRTLGQLRTQDELETLFPAYEIATHTDLITLSRFPIADVSRGRIYLRTDITIGGRSIAIFNIHTTSPYTLKIMNQPHAFITDLQERFAIRARQFAELSDALQQSSFPFIAAGDYNTLRSMGIMRRMFSEYQDIGSTHVLLPGSWGPGSLKLWRIDFSLLSRDLALQRYRQISADAFTDHRGMLFEVAW
jgi:endonuclease/exonuclease/phosphatase (EEP) superfamily protein YafD